MQFFVDVKGAFLNGEFTNGEKIYMKVPKGMEKHYPPNVVLLLLTEMIVCIEASSHGISGSAC